MDFRQMLMNAASRPAPLPPPNVAPPQFPHWNPTRMPTFAMPPAMGPMARMAYDMAGVPGGRPTIGQGSGLVSSGYEGLLDQVNQLAQQPQVTIPTQPTGATIAAAPGALNPMDIIRAVTRGNARNMPGRMARQA